MHTIPPTSPEASREMQEQSAPSKGRRRKSSTAAIGTSPSSPKSKHTKCSNCATDNTPLWRKGADGNTLCNKCGVYWKRHSKNRPLEQREQERRDEIENRVIAEEPMLAASSPPPPIKAATPATTAPTTTTSPNKKRPKKTSSSTRARPVSVIDEFDEGMEEQQEDLFLQPTKKKRHIDEATDDTEDLAPSPEQLMSLQQQLAAFAIMQQKLAGHSNDLHYSFLGECNLLSDAVDPKTQIIL